MHKLILVAACVLAFPSSALAEEGFVTDEAPGPRETEASQAPPPEPVLVRNSPGLMAGGIVLLSAGALSSVLGVAWMLAQDSGQASCEAANDALINAGLTPNDCSSDANSPVVGGTLIGVGLAGVGAGIPMTVVGAKRVPLEPELGVFVVPSRGGLSAGIGGRF